MAYRLASSSPNTLTTVEVGATVRQFTATELAPESAYIFRLSAKTRQGWGEPLEATVITTERRGEASRPRAGHGRRAGPMAGTGAANLAAGGLGPARAARAAGAAAPGVHHAAQLPRSGRFPGEAASSQVPLTPAPPAPPHLPGPRSCPVAQGQRAWLALPVPTCPGWGPQRGPGPGRRRAALGSCVWPREGARAGVGPGVQSPTPTTDGGQAPAAVSLARGLIGINRLHDTRLNNDFSPVELLC